MAQPYCDDVVLVAGFFSPNAPTLSEPASPLALRERERLIGRGAYLSERVLLAVTPLEVVAIAMGPGAMTHLQRVVWRRPEVVARLIPSRAVGRGRTDDALCVAWESGLPQLELEWDPDDAASQAVVDCLLVGSRQRHPHDGR
jgi:hypothetical protein